VLETLKLIAPDVVRVALLFNPDTISNALFLQSLEATAPHGVRWFSLSSAC
jgi:hypothetical protein